MSQPAATHLEETDCIDESLTSSPILDSATITAPADCGLNLSTDRVEAPTNKPRTRRSPEAPVKAVRSGPSGLLRSRKVRLLLTLASLLLIFGLIGLSVNRLPIVAEAESEELDLSEIGESATTATANDSAAEPRRHDFDTQFEDHPLMRNATQTRVASGWSTDLPPTGTGTGIVPVTNFSDSRQAATSQPCRAPASGSQGAWLTGQIESDESAMPPAGIRSASEYQVAPRQSPMRPRHPLAD
jgi:hypothetical protein